MINKNLKTKYDVIIAGGGASGMMAACFCATYGKSVCILEKNKKLGRKLSATGNGKCNLSNSDMSVEKYPECESTFVERLISEYSTDEIVKFFEKIGILVKSRSGYLYPMSEQAQSVTGALEVELERLHVTVVKNCEILSANKKNDLFTLETVVSEEEEKGKKKQSDAVSERISFTSEKLILALGGPAAPVYGAGTKAYEILEKFGHKVIEPKPALVPLTVADKVVKQLSGVRLDAEIILNVNDKSYKEQGEIIFAADGVSGIPVFQLSRYVSNADSLNRCKLSIDLLPKLSKEELKTFLLQLSNRNPGTTFEYLFRGLLNYKAVYYLMLEKGINPEEKVANLSEKTAEKLADIFKKFSLQVTGTKGFEQAQTSTGGLPVGEVEELTLESKKVKGLYVTGEVLNVDGNCGGYNLHFAWATGMRAGKAAGKGGKSNA